MTKKINGLNLAVAMADTMQFETDIGGTIANKAPWALIKNDLNTAGILSNVAYLDQDNVLTGKNNFEDQVFIGTGTPILSAGNLLDIGGSTQVGAGVFSRVAITSDDNSIQALQLQNKSAGANAGMCFIIAADDNNYMAFTTPSSINSGNFFGITKSTATFIFNDGGFRHLAIGTLTTGDLVLATNDIERARILGSNGYFGIGKTPTTMLDVDGTISGTILKTPRIEEAVTDDGIEFFFSGHSCGKFYDYGGKWFTFSGSGLPDDGCNIYAPRVSSDDWYIGWGMANTDLIYMGKSSNQFILTGDGQLEVQKLELSTGEQVDNIIPGTLNNTNLVTQGYMDDAIVAGNFWQRVGIDLSPKTADDNVSLGTGGLKDNDVTTAIALGDASNTSFATINKTIVGSVNELNTTVNSILSSYSRRKAVINYVDCTAVPPTEILGDRYILDFTAGSVHANWDGAAKGDIVEFDGSLWAATTPEEGWIAYVDTQNKDILYVDDGTPTWEYRDISTANHNDLLGLQGGTTDEYYHFTSSEHTELSNWLDNVGLSTDGTVNLASGATYQINDIVLLQESQLDIDNIRIDANTISSTNTDGNINLTPDGNGEVINNGAVTVNGKLTVTGIIDPTGLALDPQGLAPGTADGILYYSSGDAEFKFRQNGAWEVLGGGGTTTFTALTDVTAPYANIGALTAVNATTDGMLESTTLLTEPAANQFALTRGTTTLTVTAGSLFLNGLTNNCVMISSGGAITESATITTSELGLLNGMVSVSTGAGNNDKLVTQGYVDDNASTVLWEADGTTVRIKSSVNASLVDLSYGSIPLNCSGLTSYGNISTVGGSLNLATNQNITIGSQTLSCDAAITHKIVGYSQFVDYQTIGVAMSNISDSAETKRYLLTMAPVDLGAYQYQAGDADMSSDPYVNASMLSGRLDGYLRLGDNNAIYFDEIYAAGNGDSGLIKYAGSGHAYAFVNNIRAGNTNSRSCAYSNSGILDLYANNLYVALGTGIGGDPTGGESSAGDVNAFVHYIKVFPSGDVLGNAVCAQDGGITTAFLNRIDFIGNLKSIYNVNDANTGLYSSFNFSQGATYILDQSAGYASVSGGYADGGITVTGNDGSWVRMNRQGAGTNYMAATGAPLYLDILECQATIDAQTAATVYINAQNLSGDIDANNGLGKIICNIAEWGGSFTADKTNVCGWIGKYADSKSYLYGYDLHLNPTEIANAHYKSGTRLTLEDEECHMQLIADDDGGAWGSYVMLSAAPSTGDNKHWVMHHAGSGQGDEFKLEYGTSTSSSSFSLSEKFMLTPTGRAYFPGLNASTGEKDVRYNPTTGELFYVV